MGAPYIKAPVVLVFKTSNRSNARTKTYSANDHG